MANEFVVTRSFYSWLCSVSLLETSISKAVPKILPTKISEAKKIASKVLPLLENTAYAERAEYWNNLLNNFKEEHA